VLVKRAVTSYKLTTDPSRSLCIFELSNIPVGCQERKKERKKEGRKEIIKRSSEQQTHHSIAPNFPSDEILRWTTDHGPWNGDKIDPRSGAARGLDWA
jgi:hypothetical protein